MPDLWTQLLVAFAAPVPFFLSVFAGWVVIWRIFAYRLRWLREELQDYRQATGTRIPEEVVKRLSKLETGHEEFKAAVGDTNTDFIASFEAGKRGPDESR